MATKQAKSRYPRLSHTKDLPVTLDAIATKLVEDPMNRERRDRGRIDLRHDLFDQVTKKISQDITDADAVFQVLPDMELAAQILIGTILSPKDMVSAELYFTSNERVFSQDLAGPLLNVVERHFKHDYKIDEHLDKVLMEVLFLKGAYVLATIPENSLDALINAPNASLEHYRRALREPNRRPSLGILGHPRDSMVAMESLATASRTDLRVQGELRFRVNDKLRRVELNSDDLTVTDNFGVLKTQRYRRDLQRRKIDEITGRYLTESLERRQTRRVDIKNLDEHYQDKTGEHRPAQVLAEAGSLDRDAVGHPLVIKLPMESVIPVHHPGEPEEHVGYFIPLDQHGRPVTRDETRDYYNDIRSSFSNKTRDNSSELLQRTREAMGHNNAVNDMALEEIQKTYAQIVETDLLNRLRNGIYGEDFELGVTENIYQVMLYRTLSAQKTTLLYLPAELVTYIAFEYDKLGVGKSLLARSKILSSIRSVLLFADTMRGVRNSTPRKMVTINLDEDDPDPSARISEIQALLLESARHGFPVGSPDVSTTLDFLARAGFEFNIQTNSPSHPATSVNMEDHQSNIGAVDSDLSDSMRRMHISSVGLHPDMVDPTSSPDFAVSVVNNNLILVRRVINYQAKLTQKYSEFVRYYTQHSSILRAELTEVVKANEAKLKKALKDEGVDTTVESIVDEFIDSITVSLPRPDLPLTQLQKDAIDNYVEVLDIVLDAHFSEDIYKDETMALDMGMVDQTKQSVRAYFIRNFIERNNYMPEISALFNLDDEDNLDTVMEIQSELYKHYGDVLGKHLKRQRRLQERWERRNGVASADEGSSTDEPPADAEDDFGGGMDDADATDSEFDDFGDVDEVETDTEEAEGEEEEEEENLDSEEDETETEEEEELDDTDD